MNIKYPLENIQILSVKEIVTSFQTDSDNGLTMSEATKRTRVFGTNIYQIQKEKSIWHILLRQFVSPIVYLLVFGAAVSLFFKDYLDAIAIGVVIFINALIGFLMEMQARSSMHALRKMDIIKCKVIREGKECDIPAENLTPGDIIMLEAGDVIPADGRLIEANHLQCDESSLTGESLPTLKSTDVLTKDAPLGDCINMVFKGASVMNGNGKAVITAISQHTQLGTITSLVESSASSATPLDKKLNALSKKLIWITLVMTLIFATTGIIQGKEWKSILETSIALAVAAIPEGLPIVATIALAYGMLLMAKRNAIVKKLSAVETLGSTSVILTDKTGTLTENKISVEMLSFPGEQVQIKIENSALRFDDGQIELSKENFEKLILIGTLCNDASAETDNEKKKATGDPIEIALLHLTSASEANAEAIKNEYERLNEVPFNSVTKIMGTLHQGPDKKFVAAKGSVEDLLVKCSKVQSGTSITDLTSTEKSNILAESEKMSVNGLRVLAFAYKEGAFQSENYLSDLIYVAMIGFLDPPRLDIKETILSCRKAGIRIVMITGDHPLTALNIAKRTGLVEQDEEQVITGKDLPAMDKLTEEWKKKILSTSVFARTTPKQKLEIEDIYQKAGNIVAMTGDGVNDAPALKKADVGIAMGLRGTAVAKETASIVLKDDSFTSITAAITHGREIFQNIQKFVIYLVSCNMSEILIVTALGLFVPAATLIPLQILFLNIVTDVFPALALGLGRGDLTVMQRPPRGFKENIISTRDWFVISAYALTLTLSVILAVLYTKHYITEDEIVLNNIAFITLTFAQLFHVFNMSSLHSKLIVNEITTNKFVWFALLLCVALLGLVFIVPELRLVLKLNVLSPQLWIAAILAGLIPLIGIQIYMSIWKKNQSHKSSA
jgi:Ca2+-transporting ATPase